MECGLGCFDSHPKANSVATSSTPIRTQISALSTFFNTGLALADPVERIEVCALNLVLRTGSRRRVRNTPPRR